MNISGRSEPGRKNVNISQYTGKYNCDSDDDNCYDNDKDVRKIKNIVGKVVKHISTLQVPPDSCFEDRSIFRRYPPDDQIGPSLDY
eukprot:scaffold798_cov79-Cylindrotheca_fusiformis.AAC.4